MSETKCLGSSCCNDGVTPRFHVLAQRASSPSAGSERLEWLDTVCWPRYLSAAASYDMVTDTGTPTIHSLAKESRTPNVGAAKTFDGKNERKVTRNPEVCFYFTRFSLLFLLIFSFIAFTPSLLSTPLTFDFSLFFNHFLAGGCQGCVTSPTGPKGFVT